MTTTDRKGALYYRKSQTIVRGAAASPAPSPDTPCQLATTAFEGRMSHIDWGKLSLLFSRKKKFFLPPLKKDFLKSFKLLCRSIRLPTRASFSARQKNVLQTLPNANICLLFDTNFVFVLSHSDKYSA